EALAAAHTDLPPCAVADARVELVAVARLRVVGPPPEAYDVAAQRRGGRRVEQRILGVVGHAAENLVLAQVVGPTLEDRVGRTTTEQRLDRVDELRQVAL